MTSRQVFKALADSLPAVLDAKRKDMALTEAHNTSSGLRSNKSHGSLAGAALEYICAELALTKYFPSEQLPTDFFSKKSGLPHAKYVKAKKAVEEHLRQTATASASPASASARTPPRRGGSARSDAGSSGGRKRAAEEQPLPSGDPKATLREKAEAAQSGTLFGKQSPRTIPKRAKTSTSSQSSPASASHSQPPASQSPVRFNLDKDHAGPSGAPRSEPPTPSKTRSGAALVLPHTPKVSSRLAHQTPTRDDAGETSRERAEEEQESSEDGDETLLEPGPGPTRGAKRRHRFMLYTQAGEAAEESEDEDQHRPGATRRKTEREAEQLQRWMEKHAALFEPGRKLGGNWEEGGWGKMPKV